MFLIAALIFLPTQTQRRKTIYSPEIILILN